MEKKNNFPQSVFKIPSRRTLSLANNKSTCGPCLYEISLLGNFTTTDSFIQYLLRKVFHKKDAMDLASQAKREGQANIITCTLEIGETLLANAQEVIQEAQFGVDFTSHPCRVQLVISPSNHR